MHCILQEFYELYKVISARTVNIRKQLERNGKRYTRSHSVYILTKSLCNDHTAKNG